ncbi:MAG: hypothetical protein MUF21_13655, partial [Gemmatimonadaceae bacterium]|nr:hypothetical protein [Gemmatimonadaceae bacterium]
MSAPVGLSRATRRRRALAALLAAITSVTTPVAAHAQDGARTERPIVRGAAVAPDAVVRLYVPAGTVRVTTWERDSVAVRGTTAPAVTVFGAGTRHAIKLGVEPATPGDTRLARADWVVTVPRRARLWVKMIDGAIETAG